MSAQPLTDPQVFWSESLAEELLRFFTGRIKCPETAAELTHDTYLGLRQSVERTPPTNIRAMAFRIAVNLAIDHQRKTMVRERHGSELEFDTVAESVPSKTQQPERILMGQERYHLLQNALSELSPDCRNAFLLHGVEGLTYSEIAQRLHISKSQVNKLLSQAMQHCSRQLGEN